MTPRTGGAASRAPSCGSWKRSASYRPALRGGSDAERAAEFADVLAWLATLANIAGVDLDAAVQAKYGGGCPGCRQSPCVCDQTEKP